jgi:hypothetical protein
MARFEGLRRSLWDTGSESAVQPALTDEAVWQARRLLGVRLPAALLDLLRHRDGGEVADSRNVFPAVRPTSWSAGRVPFDSVLGIGRRAGTMSLLDGPCLVGEWGLPAGVVLVPGDGPCWVGLDCRVCGPHGEPSVTWFDGAPARNWPSPPASGPSPKASPPPATSHEGPRPAAS